MTNEQIKRAKEICEPYKGMNGGIGQMTILFQKQVEALDLLLLAIEEITKLRMALGFYSITAHDLLHRQALDLDDGNIAREALNNE